MPLANATASSLVSVAIFGAATSANYALSGLVDGPLIICLLIGGAAGGVGGIIIAKALAERAALGRKLFAGLILLVAFYVAWQAAAGLLAAPA